MNKYVNIIVWPVLYLAFLACAIGIRQKVTSEGLSEIWGWDYRTFVNQIQTWGYISYFGFRHPGLGFLLSPLVALEHLWCAAYVVVMPSVALLTAALIKRMSGWVGLMVWLSFPTTWLMAGTPESFPIAQLALVASVFVGLGVKGVGCKSAIVLSTINGLVTLTNGVKPMLGYLVTCRDKKRVLRIAAMCAGLAVLGAAFFYARTLITGRGCMAGIAKTLSWIPESRDLPRELYDFFVRPVGFYQSFVVYPLVVFGMARAFVAKRFKTMSMLCAYFLVDVIIHLVIGWGGAELWVFAPHWIWILPLLCSSGVGRLKCL